MNFIVVEVMAGKIAVFMINKHAKFGQIELHFLSYASVIQDPIFVL